MLIPVTSADGRWQLEAAKSRATVPADAVSATAGECPRSRAYHLAGFRIDCLAQYNIGPCRRGCARDRSRGRARREGRDGTYSA